MDEKKAPNENSSRELDLSALSSLSFEPEWASDNKRGKISVERATRDDRRGGRPPRRGRPDFSRGENSRKPASDDKRRDRAPDGFRPRRDGDAPADARQRHGGFRGERKGGERFHHHGKPGMPRAENFQPPRVVEIAFFAEDKPFNVLTDAVKKSGRTFELFEIANLILEKPERFVVAMKPATEKKAEGGETPKFFASVPDGMPFLNEADALAYVFSEHADKFFTIETAEVEPPKGNFTMVAKCGFTGELLAPPNYHAYQQILRDFHAANFPKMPFEKFSARLETVKDPAAVETWLAKMKTVTRYTVKDRTGDEPETLDGAGAAKAFLATHRKDKAVRETPLARIPGKLLARMPMGPMKTNIEAELANQRKFPLDTANSLRGRLRHAGFSLFKHGKRGITLVCAVRRKFRTPDSVFSDTIQRVFDFLEKHPNTKIQELPAKMLGIEPATEKAPEPASLPPAPPPPVPDEFGNIIDIPESSAAPVENAPAPEPAPEAAPATATDEAQATELLATVRWLVLEGYVTELSDGSLFTYPKMTQAQAKAAANADAANAAANAEKAAAEESAAPAEEKPDDIAAEIPVAPDAPDAPSVPEAPSDAAEK